MLIIVAIFIFYSKIDSHIVKKVYSVLMKDLITCVITILEFHYTIFRSWILHFASNMQAALIVYQRPVLA